MTRALLDVSVLIALMDPAHLDHDRVDEWAATELSTWATCALTQVGFVRVISQPRYPNAIPVAEAIEALRQATSASSHEFWTCETSLVDEWVIAKRLLGHRQVTDS